MKKSVCVLLIAAIFIAGTGCAGSKPNPIAIHMPGDENKSCNALRAEITNINKQIKIKKNKKTEKEISNLIWFAGGFFLIVPWFFMDLNNAEKVEIEALQQRKDALTIIANEKKCGI